MAPNPKIRNEHFRRIWVTRGYSRNAGSAIATLPPERAFRRLYHLSSAEHALSNIMFRRLKIATFGEMNDPFELLATSFYEDRIQIAVLEHKEHVNNTRGALCFSTDWCDPVLWSHYASNHRGICLGFDVWRSNPRKILYRPKRLVRRLNKGTKVISDALKRDLERTKYASWAYEQEWRVWTELRKAKKESGLRFAPFDGQLRLAEVIVGPLCTLPIDKIRNLVNAHYPGIITFQARLADKFYSLVPKEGTYPMYKPGQFPANPYTGGRPR